MKRVLKKCLVEQPFGLAVNILAFGAFIFMTVMAFAGVCYVFKAEPAQEISVGVDTGETLGNIHVGFKGTSSPAQTKDRPVLVAPNGHDDESNLSE